MKRLPWIQHRVVRRHFIDEMKRNPLTYHPRGRTRNQKATDEGMQLGKFIGNGPGIWLRRQETYDLWQTEREITAVLKEIKKFKAA